MQQSSLKRNNESSDNNYENSNKKKQKACSSDDSKMVTGTDQPIGDDIQTSSRSITSSSEQLLVVDVNKTSKKKRLCANGPVNVDKQIYIAQELMKDKLLEPIELGQFCLLISPSQSGKTSLIRNTLIPTLKEKYCPIFVDMRCVVSEYKHSKLQINFIDCLISTILKEVSSTETSPPPENLQQLFSSDVKYFSNKKVILIFDEIDSIAEIDIQVRKIFLGELSSMKQNKEFYCLHSFLALTNCIGDCFDHTLGNTPFNITTTLYGDYFSEKEVDEFFNEYQQEYNKKISSEIRRSIYKLTTGAQSQIVMLTLYYNSLCGQAEFINDNIWHSSIALKSFWTNLSTYQYFDRIESVLKDTLIVKSLLIWFKLKNEPTSDDIIDILVKSNILRRSDNGLMLTSPLVERYIHYRLTSSIECKPLEVMPILQNNGHIDFVKLLPLIIKSMNRMYLIDCDTNTKQNHITCTYPEGPTEIVYQKAFREAVQTLLSKNFTVHIISQLSSTVITIGDYTIIVEHCANVSMNPMGNDDRNTLNYSITQVKNVSKRFEPLYENEKRQHFILHWTTVPNNTVEFKYQFPTCNASIIYIYHDTLFSNIEMVTENNTSIKFSIDISPPPNTTTTMLQRVKGSFDINGIEFNMDDCTRWSPDHIKTLLTSSNSENGIGLVEQQIQGVEFDGTDFEQIIRLLIKYNRDIDRIVRDYLSDINNRVAKTIVEWVNDHLIEK